MEDSRVNSARKSASLRRLRLAVAVAPLLFAIAGCANTQSSVVGGSNTPALQTGSVNTIDPSFAVAPEERITPDRPGEEEIVLSEFSREAAELAMEDGQTYAALVHLSRVYKSDPKDKKVIYDYARHLRYHGMTTEALTVLNNGLNLYPGDALLTLERAKSYIAAGTAEAALVELKPLLTSRPEDPSILQTHGIALDRLGRHPEAQEAYQLAIAQGRPSAGLLNNAGLSYLISGDIDRAEELLRQAVVSFGAGPQVRQNLAMTLAIKGDTEEAKAYALQAVPKATARELIAFYESIVRQQDAWSIAAQSG